MESIWINSIDGIRLQAAVHRSCLPNSLGTVIQVHGITVDMNEAGIYVRLADHLAESGFDVLRFSFRGHGESGGTQRGMTIAGEMLDLQAALDFAARELPGPLAIIAASFGAVSTCLSLPFIQDDLFGLALWCPVLDLKKTFIAPELPWAKQSFTEAAARSLSTQGYLLLDGKFEIGRVLYEEMRTLDPLKRFIESDLPSMIAHGDRDTYVPYDTARDAAAAHSNCTFHTIEGSDHGFETREIEDGIIELTAKWLEALVSIKRRCVL